jgi:hypothetical protein
MDERNPKVGRIIIKLLALLLTLYLLGILETQSAVLNIMAKEENEMWTEFVNMI